jgi:hypothetical protein
MHYIDNDPERIAKFYKNTFDVLENEVLCNFDNISCSYIESLDYDNYFKEQLIEALLQDNEDLAQDIFMSLETIEQPDVISFLVKFSYKNKLKTEMLKKKISDLAISFLSDKIDILIEYLKEKNHKYAKSKDLKQQYYEIYQDRNGPTFLDSARDPF